MDLNFGAGSSVTPYNFSMPAGMGSNMNPGYGSLSTFGMPTPTGGGVDSTWAPAGGWGGAAGGGNMAGLGMNIPTLQLGFQGLSSLANLYTGLKALGLAQDQFGFQKDMAQKNLANSTQSYNTALTDRATARGVMEGQSGSQVQNYINTNKLAG
jgi:hypothetical protein